MRKERKKEKPRTPLAMTLFGSSLFVELYFHLMHELYLEQEKQSKIN